MEVIITLRRTSLILLLALAGWAVLLAALLFIAAAPADASPADAASGRVRPGIRGQITTLADDGFTLENPRGTLEIIIDEETSFRIIGLENPTLADLAVGDQVLVRGRRHDSAFLAGFVARVPAGDRVGGLVESVEELEITVTGRDGQTITIAVDPNTWLAIRGEDYTWTGDPPSQDVLAPGMPLVAFGTAGAGEPSLSADALLVLPRPHPRIIVGEVTGIGTESFSFTTRYGRELTVLVDENTRFRLPGVTDPGLDDLVVGDRLAVFGRPVAEGQFLAHGVARRPPR